MKKVLLPLAFAAVISTANAQSTFEGIYSIFQANCTVGCHSGTSPSANLNLKENGDMAAVYNNIVGVNPVNPTAVSKGFKLIDPGYPERSFLLRKCSTQEWDSAYDLEISEGNNMPDGPSVLNKQDIELIRQWINYGSPETGQVVDPQLLFDYYNGLGMPRIEVPPSPQDEGLTGYQIHMGPFFLPPLSEVEYRWKYDIQEPDSLEVYRTNSFFNDESHHFILYKYSEGIPTNNIAEGYRLVGEGDFFSLDQDQVTAWQDPYDNALPTGTAYKWQANTVLDNNYHILNYESDSVLPAEAYINVYTQPIGTANAEMLSTLIPINAFEQLLGTGQVGQDLIIPNDGQEHTFNYTLAIPVAIPDWHVWNIWAHTHARGTDYDVYLRNANGSKGEQIYEGFYDPTYTFNTGSYDWEHPPVRVFDPLLQIDMSKGFIQEAKYVNNTSDTLRWGLTTADEMMLISIQYTEVSLSDTVDGIDEDQSLSFLSVSPNPFTDNFTIHYTLTESADINVELYDIYGRFVQQIESGKKPFGRHKLQYDLSNTSLADGTYLLRFTANGKTTSKRLLHTSR